MKFFSKTQAAPSAAAATQRSQGTPRFPGIPTATDGSSVVVHAETLGGEAAGAYPITPSTQMGEGWAAAVGAGKHNVFGRKLVFFEPEGEHAAAAVTAGMSMTGLRSANFSSGQGIAYMHESLYAAVGKRLTYVLNMACRAMTKSTLNVHAGHDDYHAVDDTGFFQMFAKSVQEAGDLCLVAHRVAELSLTPGICAQDGFLTSHVIENAKLVEPELVKEYLGDPSDMIPSPTAAQRLVFGEHRRRIPELFDVDNPAMLGVVQNQDSYAQSVAAQRPFYFDHIQALTDRAMAEFGELTGRHYARVMGYKTEDAEFLLLGQGSVCDLAEVVVDHLREVHGIKAGVVNMTMFRPFPTDLLPQMLAGKKAVCILERLDQPLSVDPPMMREVRSAMGQAVENGRSSAPSDNLPHEGVTPVNANDVPEFYSACFGMGSRDLQPMHLIAAVKNMQTNGRRMVYLGIDFIHKGHVSPKLELWQQELVDAYPHIAGLALEPAESINLIPAGHTSVRIHSIGGWGAITMGKNLGITASDLLGLYIKANPKYGSEKAGQPTTFYATLAPEPIKVGGELLDVDVVLSQDPNAFHHTNPLMGVGENGVVVIQTTEDPEAFWQRLPKFAQATIRKKNIALYKLDGFKIAREESTNDDLRYRMQGVAFLGAFFKCSHLMQEHGLTEERLTDGLTKQITKKFSRFGQAVVDDNMRVIKRGFDEVVQVDYENYADEGAEEAASPTIPASLARFKGDGGIGDAGRFWEQVGHLYQTGKDPIADPFIAMSAIPAATSAMRDMTHVRFEVPKFIPENCTGCSQCWSQCPDSAIPGMVHTFEEIVDATVKTVSKGKGLAKFKTVQKHVVKEAHKLMGASKTKDINGVLNTAFETIKDKLKLSPEKRKDIDAEFALVAAALQDFPIARTGPFWDAPEKKGKGTGGLLSITVNPETCKGCMECVDVCPDGALELETQTDDVVGLLRSNQELWHNLPETDPRFVKIANLEEGIGTLSSMMIQRSVYGSMLGGDGACMGCGEKTNIHLFLAALNALMEPRVEAHLTKLRGIAESLEARARQIAASDVNLSRAAKGDSEALELSGDDRAAIAQLEEAKAAIADLVWRYEEGPSGRGRAKLAMANSTGCTSVWASTFPYNPYPFPWVNHLFQDSPSIALGVFEGHMRKMADGFVAVRRAEAILDGSYKADELEPVLAKFDWHDFNDEEFHLSPPIVSLGGDGAMLDIGFQNLSRLMASGHPIKVVVLDTQVYSNTGGQACTSGFTGQISDMATYGDGNHGKTERRKELALIAMAHRGVFVAQSSQAMPAHVLKASIRAINTRNPAVLVLHSPCMPEHLIEADAGARQAKLALSSRAYPILIFDPENAGDTASCLELDGNPAMTKTWSTYKLDYVDDNEQPQQMELPMTVADWAATEGRFKKHFTKLEDDTNAMHYGEYVLLDAAGREGHTPFIYTLGKDAKLGRLKVSPEICKLGHERLEFWHELLEIAGRRPSERAHEVVEAELQNDLETQMTALRAEYEGKMTALKASYPISIARSIAKGLLASADGSKTIAEILAESPVSLDDIDLDTAAPAAPTAAAATPAAPAAPVAVAEAPAQVEAPAPAAVEEDDDEELAIEAYIDTDSCTSCNECIQTNEKIFAYNDDGLAEVIDPEGGPFKDIVMAAEKCPVAIIHPGTPLNPKEKDLDEWVKRAEEFN